MSFKMKGWSGYQAAMGKSPLEFEKDPAEFAKRKSGPKNKKNTGNIVYKNGKKYYKASDGTLHTGQVSDYEAELKADKERYYSNKDNFQNLDEID